MPSATLSAPTACAVASPGRPGPTPTSLTLLMAPRPSPTRDTAVRLELSADHVGGQRLEGIARLTLLNRLELTSRERGILLCDGRRLPRCSARAHDLDDLPSLFRHQLMTVPENRLQP